MFWIGAVIFGICLVVTHLGARGYWRERFGLIDEATIFGATIMALVFATGFIVTAIVEALV